MAAGWVGCSGAGTRPPNCVCGAQFPFGLFPCPWGVPSPITQGNGITPWGSPGAAPPPLGMPAWGNWGVSGVAAWPGVPHGAQGSQHHTPLPSPPLELAEVLGELSHSRGCSQPRAQPGGIGAGTGRCRGGGTRGLGGVRPLAPVLFHSVLFLSLRSAGHGQPDKGIGQRFRKLSSFFPGF